MSPLVQCQWGIRTNRFGNIPQGTVFMRHQICFIDLRVYHCWLVCVLLIEGQQRQKKQPELNPENAVEETTGTLCKDLKIYKKSLLTCQFVWLQIFNFPPQADYNNKIQLQLQKQLELE